MLLVVEVQPEPACSKFDYEEKILAKLIRMEIEVDQVLKETKQTVASMQKELDDFRRESIDTTKQVDTQISELEQLKTSVTNLAEAMRNQMDEYTVNTKSMVKGNVFFITFWLQYSFVFKTTKYHDRYAIKKN